MSILCCTEWVERWLLKIWEGSNQRDVGALWEKDPEPVWDEGLSPVKRRPMFFCWVCWWTHSEVTYLSNMLHLNEEKGVGWVKKHIPRGISSVTSNSTYQCAVSWVDGCKVEHQVDWRNKMTARVARAVWQSKANQQEKGLSCGREVNKLIFGGSRC